MPSAGRVQLPGAVVASSWPASCRHSSRIKNPEPVRRRIIGGQLPGSGATVFSLRLFCSPGKISSQINRSRRSSPLRPAPGLALELAALLLTAGTEPDPRVWELTRAAFLLAGSGGQEVPTRRRVRHGAWHWTGTRAAVSGTGPAKP